MEHNKVRTLKIGSGAGYSGDRIEPAVALAQSGQIGYLVFECLAERTIALAQQARLRGTHAGYDVLLEARMRAVLPAAHAQGLRIITNMGAANPMAAAQAVVAVARALGIHGLRVAAVLGDDVLAQVQTDAAGIEYQLQESSLPLATLGAQMVSANAYLGVQPIVDALRAGAQVVVTGRVADPALFMAPLVHEFGWSLQDYHRLGQATLAGHLLECAGQITGGYFADPGVKEVPNLAQLGFPIGEVGENGSIVITKLPGTGGLVSAASCKEQLLYEVHDPQCYYQPDVVADFSQVQVEEIAPDRVRVWGATGAAPTGTLKVSVGYTDGYVGEGQISYAGQGALARAQLARDIVLERLRTTGVQTQELRCDFIGLNALHGEAIPQAIKILQAAAPPYEVRLRVAGRAATQSQAQRIANEVETLYTNGPAGGGGATGQVREVLAVQSVLLPRSLVRPQLELLES